MFFVDGYLLHEIKCTVDSSINHSADDGIISVQMRLLGVENEELRSEMQSMGKLTAPSLMKNVITHLFVSLPLLAMATMPR